VAADPVTDLLRRLAGGSGANHATARPGAGEDGCLDGAELLIDLYVQQIGYRTALAVTARIPQPSLADFLR
jgi:hypothetical protein